MRVLGATCQSNRVRAAEALADKVAGVVGVRPMIITKLHYSPIRLNTVPSPNIPPPMVVP